MENVKTRIAKNILFYRKKNKLSQKELAEKIGVKHNTISSWESCTNSVDIDNLFKMCEVFKLSIDDFVNEYNTAEGSKEQQLTNVEKSFLSAYNNLNELGKSKARDYINDLNENEKYILKQNTKG